MVTQKETPIAVGAIIKIYTLIIPQKGEIVSIEETIANTVEVVITSVLVEKLAYFEPDESYPPIMTMAKAREWLKIGNDTLRFYISKGMPVIYNENGKERIPRDAVKEWLKTNWKDLT